MMGTCRTGVSFAALLALCACVTAPPNQPSVLVLPGSGKTFDQFRADNDACKQFAYAEVGGQSPGGAGFDSGVRSAAVGTVLGAAAGAAANGGRGASVGAGAGLALGGLAGTGTAESSSARLQRQYDNSFVQCMYAKGHRVPVSSGDMMSDFFRGRSGRYVSPPPAAAPPPPPNPPPASNSPAAPPR